MTERRRLDEWAKDLDRFEPDAQRAEETRNRLLDEVASTPPAQPWRWRVAIAAAVVVVVAVVGWIASQRPESNSIAEVTPSPQPSAVATATPGSLAQIRPAPKAVYRHIERGPTERVRLVDGTVDFEVQELEPEERFVVMIGLSEVEVRGTHFEVIAHDEELEDVVVSDGTVEVRHQGHLVAVHAGQRWSIARATPTPTPIVRVAKTPTPVPATPEPTPAEVEVEVEVTPEATPVPTAPEVARPTLPGEEQFLLGWSAFRAGNYGHAADAFAVSCEQAEGSAYEEDACFYYGVALARGESSSRALAADALRTFLQRWPASAHATNAHELLKDLE